MQTRKAVDIGPKTMRALLRTQLRQLRQLFGMDLWVYSRTLYFAAGTKAVAAALADYRRYNYHRWW